MSGSTTACRQRREDGVRPRRRSRSSLKRAAGQVKANCGAASDDERQGQRSVGHRRRPPCASGATATCAASTVPAPYDGQARRHVRRARVQNLIFPPYAAPRDVTVDWDIELGEARSEAYDYDLVVLGGGPAGEKGRGAGGVLRQARRDRRARARAGRRRRAHRHAAVEDAARDGALPLGLPAARALRPQRRARTGSSPCRSSCRARTRCASSRSSASSGTSSGTTSSCIRGDGARRRRAHRRDAREGAPRTHHERDHPRRHGLDAVPAAEHPVRRRGHRRLRHDPRARSRSRRRMVVIGGGVIGCEYASMFAAMGVKVTLVEGRDATAAVPRRGDGRAPARRDDRRSASTSSSARRVEKVERVGRRRRTCSLDERRDDRVRQAARRRRAAAAAPRGSARGGRRRASTSAATCRSTTTTGRRSPSIYAAGDVIGFPALASTSMEQARVAVCHAFGFTYKRQVSHLLPYGIYTIPEVSCVGLSEEEAQGEEARLRRRPRALRDNARGKIIGDNDGVIKLVFDARHAQAPRRALHRRPRDASSCTSARRSSRSAAPSTRSSRWSSTTRRSPRCSSTPPTTRSGIGRLRPNRSYWSYEENLFGQRQGAPLGARGCRRASQGCASSSCATVNRLRRVGEARSSTQAEARRTFARRGTSPLPTILRASRRCRGAGEARSDRAKGGSRCPWNRFRDEAARGRCTLCLGPRARRDRRCDRAQAVKLD